MGVFAYYALNTDQNRQLYREAKRAITGHASRISLRGNSLQEINEVLHAVLTDTPNCFWFEGKWRLEKCDEVIWIAPQYICCKVDAEKMRANIEQTVKDFKPILLGNLHPYKKICFIYDWILDHIQYDLTESFGQTIYGVFVKRKAVCKGISKAFQFLLDQAGIFSTLQEGTIDGISKHVWNIVELDEKYYHVDICMGYKMFSYLFDEDTASDRYRCFMVSDAQLQKTHRLIHQERLHLTCDDELGGTLDESYKM